MSTKIAKYFIPYPIQSKRFSLRKDHLQLLRKSLTGPWVSKAGRPHLYGSRAYREVFEHVPHRLYAAYPYYW